jgi:hypothetical protein
MSKNTYVEPRVPAGAGHVDDKLPLFSMPTFEMDWCERHHLVTMMRPLKRRTELALRVEVDGFVWGLMDDNAPILVGSTDRARFVIPDGAGDLAAALLHVEHDVRLGRPELLVAIAIVELALALSRCTSTKPVGAT